MEIVKLGEEHIDKLIEFYYWNETDFKWFKPHPFNREYLEKLLKVVKNDKYFVITDSNNVVGYGMLRGWDDGWEIPTLGIAIGKRYQGMGIGKMFVLFLHCVCKFEWCTTVRIGVMKENKIAKELYEKVGYVFTEDKGDREYGYIRL